MENSKLYGNQRVLEHHSLYKLKTPPWKETVRMRCLQRLKHSRGRLVDKFRGLGLCSDEVIEVLMTENTDISKQQSCLKLNELGDEEIDEFLSIVQEIQKEMLEEEKKWLEEYDALIEENNLETTIDWIEKDEVICPLCKRNPLHQNHSIIFCACGMRIDTQQDGLTLQHLKRSLLSGSHEHEETCRKSPVFSIIHFGDTRNLVMTCEVCNFMYIVI